MYMYSSAAQVLPGGQKPQSHSGLLAPIDQFITPAKTLKLFTVLTESRKTTGHVNDDTNNSDPIILQFERKSALAMV